MSCMHVYYRLCYSLDTFKVINYLTRVDEMMSDIDAEYAEYHYIEGEESNMIEAEGNEAYHNML